MKKWKKKIPSLRLHYLKMTRIWKVRNRKVAQVKEITKMKRTARRKKKNKKSQTMRMYRCKQ
jgi:hypothetical protein